MGMFCFAVLIFLIMAKGDITSMRGYIQVHYKSFSTEICRFAFDSCAMVSG